MKISININAGTHLFRDESDTKNYITLLSEKVCNAWPDADVYAAVSDMVDLIAVAGFTDNEAVKSTIYAMKSALWEKGSWVIS